MNDGFGAWTLHQSSNQNQDDIINVLHLKIDQENLKRNHSQPEFIATVQNFITLSRKINANLWN